MQMVGTLCLDTLQWLVYTLLYTNWYCDNSITPTHTHSLLTCPLPCGLSHWHNCEQLTFHDLLWQVLTTNFRFPDCLWLKRLLCLCSWIPITNYTVFLLAQMMWHTHMHSVQFMGCIHITMNMITNNIIVFRELVGIIKHFYYGQQSWNVLQLTHAGNFRY